jgi:hypothetical protein
MFGRGAMLGVAMMCGVAHAQAPSPDATFAGLTGWCWRAELSEGASDTHCFSMAVGGKLVMDVHKVHNVAGEVVYEGVTTYRLEKETGVIRYDYYNSLGDLLVGYAKRDGDRIRFPEKPDQAGDIVWYLGKDAYEVGTAAVTGARRKFVKSGPA